jgi:uncharacterized glyoxalase superfamily protein PhnB
MMSEGTRQEQFVFPHLRITKYKHAKEFYVDKLGFTIDWEWRHEPGLPVFMRITKDGRSLFLSEHEGDGPTGTSVSIYLPDVDKWYQEFADNGVEIKPPDDEPWGERSTTFCDPDGNRISISTVLDK